MDPKHFLTLIETAVRQREQLIRAKTPCRIVDGVGDNLPALTAVLLGDVLVFHTYAGKTKFTPEYLTGVSPHCAEITGASSVVLWSHEQLSRSGPTEGELLTGIGTDEIVVEEHGVPYLARPLRQRNAGFFVDMREVRRFLLRQSVGRRVLNTFCFTGSLGIAALRGGAAEVVQNDISQSALNWAKENYALQKTATGVVRYIREDTRAFLRREKRRIENGNESYSLVILDPPSFGHSEGKAFSLAKELPELLRLSIEVVAPGGTLIISANTRELSGEFMLQLVRAAARHCKRRVLQHKLLTSPAEDFRNAEHESDAMRGVLAQLE